MVVTILVALPAVAAAQGAGAREPVSAEEAAEASDRLRVPVDGPPVAAVVSAAYAAAGLDQDPRASWVRRARLAGLIPWITVRNSRDASWQDGQSEVGHAETVEVRATWRLDRLLFDTHELQAASIDAARRRDRRRLAARVVRAYFAWRRAAGIVPRSDDDPAPERAAEATAELDALTDGWFSDEQARRTRGASETRTSHRTAP